MIHWYKVHFVFFLFFRMSALCELGPDDALPAVHLMDWLRENCPDRCLSPGGTLAAQLARALEMDEHSLCLGVESVLTDMDTAMMEVRDSWLREWDVSLDQYLDQVQLMGENSDGLFCGQQPSGQRRVFCWHCWWVCGSALAH